MAANPDFPGRRIGEEFNVLHALPQLVEDDGTASEQRSTVDRRLGAMTVTFKQAHPEHMFKVGDRLRYDRPGNGEVLRRRRQTFALHDGEQDMQVAQPDAATDAFRPLHRALLSVAKRLP